MRDNVMGRDDVIELVLVALLADGHVPARGLSRAPARPRSRSALGNSIDDDLPDDDIPSFRRIQFTPDLLPSDVTGVTIFDTQHSTFQFRRGPIFAHVVLADEINRTSPKVQAALLEAMAEKQVTVDNDYAPARRAVLRDRDAEPARRWPAPIRCRSRSSIASCSSSMMKHIDRETELEVLRTWGQPREIEPSPARQPRCDRRARADPAHAGRGDRRRSTSASSTSRSGCAPTSACARACRRAASCWRSPALQTLAMLRGRDFVSTEDVEYLAVPLFAHRLELAPGAKAEQ